MLLERMPAAVSVPFACAHMSCTRARVCAMRCRAYKLGKGRQSYNMLNVQLYDANDSSRRLEPTHAARVILLNIQQPEALSMRLSIHAAMPREASSRLLDSPISSVRCRTSGCCMHPPAS